MKKVLVATLILIILRILLLVFATILSANEIININDDKAAINIIAGYSLVGKSEHRRDVL